MPSIINSQKVTFLLIAFYELAHNQALVVVLILQTSFVIRYLYLHRVKAHSSTPRCLIGVNLEGTVFALEPDFIRGTFHASNPLLDTFSLLD